MRESQQMSIYTLRMPKDKSSGGTSHVFEAKPGAGKGCICLPKSLCQKVPTSETTALEQYMCLSEVRMRVRAGDFGREVCGACMAALYGSEDQK